MACKDKKYFPADPDLNILTFLNDKKINGELYAYLQSISDFVSKDNGQNRYTYVLKKKIPTQAKVCSLLGIKSPKTYRNHLKYLIDQGYLEEEQDRYVLPEKEEIYFLIPLETLRYLTDNCKDHIIKIYIYLGHRYKQSLWRGNNYDFTLEELGQHLGINVKNNSRGYTMLNNALDLLYNSGLIDYYTYFDGQMQKKKLVGFSYDYNKAKIKMSNG